MHPAEKDPAVPSSLNLEKPEDTPVPSTEMQPKKENVKESVSNRLRRQPLHQAGHRGRNRAGHIANHLPSNQLSEQHRKDHINTSDHREPSATVLLSGSGSSRSRRHLRTPQVNPQSSLTKVSESPTINGMRAKTLLTVLIIGAIVASAGVGYALGAGVSGSINGPGPSGTITINPSLVSFNSASMNWATGVLSLSLSSSGVASGSCNAVFNPGSVSSTVAYSFTVAGGPTTFSSSPLTFSQTPTSISIQC